MCNKLLKTAVLQEGDFPDYVVLGKAMEEDVGNDEMEFKPTYVIRSKTGDGDEETRLIGHAEFLGGRPGALTWAIEQSKNNAWGSLRCVLGESPVPFH